MLATAAVGPLASAFGFGEDSARKARIQMIMMSITMGMMIAEMGVFTSATVADSNAKVVNTVVTHQQRNALHGVAHAYHVAAAAARSFGLAIGAGLVLIGISIILERAADFLGLFGDEAESATEAMERMSAETQAASDQAFELMLSQQQEIEAVMGVGQAYSDAADEIHKFGNSREELFFGFKAGNVTGDLVKQVQQQGVENFVANTEIIMTNNFNGMTTDEVADTILEKIEERAAMENIGVTRT